MIARKILMPCLLTLLLFISPGCQFSKKSGDGVELQSPSGQIIQTRLAINEKDQTQGLSGLPSDQFKADQAMLFIYSADGPRRFWMPDTYFDLDIFFLDADLMVLAVERNVPHHPGRATPPDVPITDTYEARHVLEMRADSPISKSIKKGDKLKWNSSDSLAEIVSRTHPPQ